MTSNEKLRLNLEQALHWIWSWQLQVGRLRESLRADLEATTAGGIRQRKASSMASFDEHVLAVAGAHVARTLDVVKRHVTATNDFRTSKFDKVLTLLRNCYEHPGSPASPHGLAGFDREIYREFPNARPFSVALGRDGDLTLGNVVSTRELSVLLEDAESEILGVEALIADKRDGVS